MTIWFYCYSSYVLNSMNEWILYTRIDIKERKKKRNKEKKREKERKKEEKERRNRKSSQCSLVISSLVVIKQEKRFRKTLCNNYESDFTMWFVFAPVNSLDNSHTFHSSHTNSDPSWADYDRISHDSRVNHHHRGGGRSGAGVSRRLRGFTSALRILVIRWTMWSESILDDL